jgi:hypothetical protein
MPIDSICTGCGKTLRVGDEFVGRNARCPVCLTVYVVVAKADSGASAESPFSSANLDSSRVETTYELTSNSQQGSSISSSQKNPFNAAAEEQSPSIFASESYFVRTPNSAIYGPADKHTVLAWIQQGRLDDSCFVRSSHSDQWLGVPAWNAQQYNPNNAQARHVTDPHGTPGSPQSYQFGAAPVPSNQSVGYPRGGGGSVVLVLGIVSWVLCPTVLGGLICGIFAIVLGLKELKHVREGSSPQSERTLVMAGMFLGILCLTAMLGCILIVIFAAAFDS